MKSLYKHGLYAGILVILIAALNTVGYYFNQGSLPSFQQLLSYFGWSMYFSLGLYAVNAPISVWSQKVFPFFTFRSMVGRLFFAFVGSGLATLLVGALLYLTMFVILGNSWREAVEWLFLSRSLHSLQMMIWIALTIAVVFQVVFLFQNLREMNLKQQQQKVLRLSTEQHSLKSQISAHFLFNSLNVLNGLIDENPGKAQEFVNELSQVYRYVLEQKDHTLVALKEEIAFSRTYLQLVQKRFEEGLSFDIIDDFSEEFKIVPLSLQILLENCIKHNRISSEEPLHISVEIHGDDLWIRNNFQPKKQMNDSTGNGLKSIVERYKNFSQKTVRIEQNENSFIVKLPLLTSKNIQMNATENYDQAAYKLAKKRVEEIQEFYWNLTSYIVINLFLTFLDFNDNGNYDWAYWPLIGWGIGVIFHAIEVFGLFNSSTWKDQMIQKELEKRKYNRFEK
ncbi:MAG TPA: 2TM domain-containing protein [Moheibacter sp.]|nr:2TM domain-containing protein [Moheibacter sp.]